MLHGFFLFTASQLSILAKRQMNVFLSALSKGRLGVIPLQRKGQKTGVFGYSHSHKKLKDEPTAFS
jgi:hypothetical protein